MQNYGLFCRCQEIRVIYSIVVDDNEVAEQFMQSKNVSIARNAETIAQ